MRGRVLMVANYAPDVGFAWWLMEAFWIRFAELAAEREMEAVIAYPVDGAVPAPIDRAAIDLVTMAVPSRGFRNTLRVLRFIKQRQVRVMYFTDRPFGALNYLLYRIAGVRWILNHDHTPGDRPPARGIKAALKWIWRRLPLINANAQLCVSPFIAKRAVENAMIPPVRTVVVQNGIDAVTGNADPHYAKREFGLPATAIVCVTVARATAYKGLDFLIQAATQCNTPPLSSVYFVHCGDGPELHRFKQMAVTAGVAHRITFAGRRTDVADILSSADFALHPSHGEAFSLSVLEYMRAGLVLLVPDTPSVSQAVIDGHTGIIYPAGNVDAMLASLAAVIANKQDRHRIGEAARQSVAEQYSTDGMMRQFDAAVHDSLIGHV